MNQFKERSARTFSSLRVRSFRLYFFGQIISQCGSWMQVIAQDWLVLRLTNSGFQLGLVTALQFLPILLFGPWGGLLADRFPKRKLIIITQSIFCVLAIALGALVITNTVQLWMLYIFAFSFGLINAADKPVRQVFLHEMVEEKDLHNAVALMSVQFNSARIVGPAIAGILISVVGLGMCFVLNGISFIGVILAIMFIRDEELKIAALVPKAKGQIREGLRYVLQTPFLRDSLIIMAIMGTFTYEFTVSLPLIAKFTFNGNASTYAALTSALGIGSVLGGLFAAGRKKILASHMYIAAGLLGVAMIFGALAPNFDTMILTMVFTGMLATSVATIASTLIQLESSPEMRGRVMSLWSVVVLGTTPIGGPIVGWIGEFASPRWSLVVGGIAAVIAAIYGWVVAEPKKQQ